MIFNSVTFLLFLVIVLSLYWTLPRTGRLLLLFAASLVFYGFWRIEYVPVMLVSVLVDYFAAIKIHETENKARRKLFLLLSLAVNLGLLAYFKYTLFVADNVVSIAQMLGMETTNVSWKIVLPIGISFYTFQSMSYTIDVYRKFIKPERNFILFGDYVMFFPQLVAGPILRAGEVLWQLDVRPAFRWQDLSQGLRRILIGLFLKVGLADNIALLVDQAFSNNAGVIGPIDAGTMAFMFGFQIYFDFSAYSHIAIGAALMMGIVFPENFHFPYSATSPREFWQRWHISLSSWIRDYLYLPLTGQKVEDRSAGGLGEAVETHHGQRVDGDHKYLPLFITWAIMGLWHGANWAFVLWGLWHASLITIYRVSRSLRERLPDKIRIVGGWFWTVPLVMLGWIPFRTQSVEQSLVIWGSLFEPARYFQLNLREVTYLIAALLMLMVLLAPLFNAKMAWLAGKSRGLHFLAETAVYSLIIGIVFIYLRPLRQFIYFQF